MKTKTHFAFRVDIWDDTGDSIVEHVAGVDDFEVAEATYRAAVARCQRRATLHNQTATTLLPPPATTAVVIKSSMPIHDTSSSGTNSPKGMRA